MALQLYDHEQLGPSIVARGRVTGLRESWLPSHRSHGYDPARLRRLISLEVECGFIT